MGWEFAQNVMLESIYIPIAVKIAKKENIQLLAPLVVQTAQLENMEMGCRSAKIVRLEKLPEKGRRNVKNALHPCIQIV